MSVVIFDSQFDDLHGVLRNKLNLKDADKLEPHIARLSFQRVMELAVSPIPGKFDITHLRLIHKYIFQDVFPWAGDFREVMTSRTESFGFPPPQYMIPALEDLFTRLKAEKHLAGLDPDSFAARAAYYLGELNAIHPFREGNGRTQREFIRCLAAQAGHRLTWKDLAQTENDEASRISYSTGDTSLLAKVIRQRLG